MYPSLPSSNPSTTIYLGSTSGVFGAPIAGPNVYPVRAAPPSLTSFDLSRITIKVRDRG